MNKLMIAVGAFLLVSLVMNRFGAMAADAPATKPVLKIIPGQVIVPFDTMRRPWGELISLDPATRTGKFRNESNDEVMTFTILPYAELLHHATFGDVQDFRVGERVIFRLHPNESGEWVWLTYIQDEMNMMLGHKEYFFVDHIDTGKGQLICTQANQDKSYVREKNIAIMTDAETRCWKAGKLATFNDIKIGDAVRTKTHGIGKGKVRVAWEVFLDDESLLKFQAEQKAVHAARMIHDGAAGYVDQRSGPAAVTSQVELTCFQESLEYLAPLRAGHTVWIAPAGVDRKPTAPAIKGTLVSLKKVGKTSKVVVKVEANEQPPAPGALVRIWSNFTK